MFRLFRSETGSAETAEHPFAYASHPFNTVVQKLMTLHHGM
jgi:hypothetical protein